MLLNTLVKTVKRKAHRGDPAVTTDQITEDIIACINEAARDVSKLLPKRFWFKQGTIAVTSGSAGTPSVWSLPSDCQEPIFFHYTSGSSQYTLKKVSSDHEWFTKIWSPVASTNLPVYFREIGPNSSTGYKQIELFPIPSSNITLNIEYYRTKGTDYTTSDLGSQITEIPDYVQDLLEKGALYYFLKGFDDPLQTIAKQDYQEAKLAFEQADEADLDGNVCFRFDLLRQSPNDSARFE